MHVKRARSAGFCFGVSLALRALNKELLARDGKKQTDGARLLMFGPIIHNPLVMRLYAAKGVGCEENPAHLRPGDRIVIRAHGIPKELEAELRDKKAVLIDATCPKVKRAQLSIEKACAMGNTLLLLGEREHPEVKGLLSYAGSEALVFGNLEELKDFRLNPAVPYVLAAQTTQERTLFLAAKKILEKRLLKEVPVLETICDATRKRQDEVISLTREVDAFVVVGGKNSANTGRLAEVARAHGIRTVHVEDAEEFSPDMLAGARVVGLTAGASTPEEHIDAMHRILEGL